MESCLAHRSDLALMRKLIFLLTIFLFTATPTPAGAADAIKGLLELPENLQEGPPTLQLKHFSLPQKKIGAAPETTHGNWQSLFWQATLIPNA
jgi:hypothetical protein